MIYGLDLFSGIGGIAAALDEWVRPIAYCEQDRFCQSVLMSRMYRGDLPKAPIFDDVRNLSARQLPNIDLISGGFPCQDISIAGDGIGLGGSRSQLFFEIIRLTRDLRPRFVFLENVPAITVRGLDRVLLEFTALGYDCRWTIVSAAEMGACHIRERWFLLAHSNGLELREEPREKKRQHAERSTKILPAIQSAPRRSAWTSNGIVKPRVGRAGDGISYRMDRHRALGNSVVPQAARKAFIKLLGIEKG